MNAPIEMRGYLTKVQGPPLLAIRGYTCIDPNSMKTYAKFAVLMALIVGALVWLAAGGISETKTYYKTIAELQQMGGSAQGHRLRVGGDVKPGSIVKSGTRVNFT